MNDIIFKKKEVPIVFCAEANYGAYLPVSVQSIIENSSAACHYTVIIFDCGIKHRDLAALERMLAAHDNFSFRVENIVAGLEAYKKAFVTRNYWSIATYGRFFIPDLCENYNKVIYADIDIIFNRDIAELLEIDLGDKYIGAVPEPENDKVYLSEILGLREDEIYINAGVIIFNIPAWRQYHLAEKAIQLLETKTLKVLDQDAINIVCRGNITYLSAVWNCQSMGGQGMYFLGRLHRVTPLWKDWEKAYHSDNALFHYNSPVKPWVDFSSDKADLWWSYAAKTPFYGRYLTDLAVKSAQRHHTDLLTEERLSSDKIYKFLGISFWTAKAAAGKKKYYIGPLPVAKKVYGREDIYFYILGLKLFSIKQKKG